MVSGATTHDDSTELETAKIARENPDAVRDFAHRVDEPLKSRLLEIVERVEREGSA